jgi:hypothetical protein
MTKRTGERLLLGGLVVLALLGVALVWWYASGGMVTEVVTRQEMW